MSVDKLAAMFDAQKATQNKFLGVQYPATMYDSNAIRNFALGAMIELSEVFQEDKRWKEPYAPNTEYSKAQATKFDHEKVKEELVDTFAYLIDLVLAYGVDANEFYELFMAKSKKVQGRA